VAGPEEGPLVDVTTALRELCGPVDVEIAQKLRPKCIRANYGAQGALNAVHCTDLPEDGFLECRFFFQVLEKV